MLLSPEARLRGGPPAPRSRRRPPGSAGRARPRRPPSRPDVPTACPPDTPVPTGRRDPSGPRVPHTPDRQPAADDLAEHGQIRTHAVERLGSAGCDAKSRDDLIEAEERAGPFGQLAQSF